MKTSTPWLTVGDVEVLQTYLEDIELAAAQLWRIEDKDVRARLDQQVTNIRNLIASKVS